jgi:hypothetical protein
MKYYYKKILDKKITIRVTPQIYQKTKILLAERGLTLGDFFTEAITKAESELLTPEYEAYLIERNREIELAVNNGKAYNTNNLNDLFKLD